MNRFAWAAGAVVLSGALACGGVKEGESCKESGFVCADDKTVFECGTSKLWRKISCRGPKGCEKIGDSVQCDLTANEEGDACPTYAAADGGVKFEGTGICSPDQRSILECREGAFSLYATCASSETCVLDSKVSCQAQ